MGKLALSQSHTLIAARSRVPGWRRAAAGLTLAILLLGLSETFTHSSGLTAVIVLLAATISSIAGFAFSPLAGALLFHVSRDGVEAIQIMLVASIALQAYSAWMLRSSIAIKDLWPYVVGGLATAAGFIDFVEPASGVRRVCAALGVLCGVVDTFALGSYSDAHAAH